MVIFLNTALKAGLDRSRVAKIGAKVDRPGPREEHDAKRAGLDEVAPDASALGELAETETRPAMTKEVMVTQPREPSNASAVLKSLDQLIPDLETLYQDIWSVEALVVGALAWLGAP